MGTTYVLPPATTSTLGGVIVSTGLSVDASGNLAIDTVEWSQVTDTPTTIAGYAITDAKIENGVITLGSATITPVVDASYVHTDNNFTTALKNKLDAIEAGAEVNTIESISVNGTAQTIDANKNVDITVPTQTSDLTNDSGYITSSEAPVQSVNGQTGAVSLTYSDVSAAPTSHASTATTYGIGTGSNYGHVKLSDSTSSTSSTSAGVAATPAAVKAAYDLANSKTDNTGTVTSVTAGTGLTGGTITTTGTIAVSYGTATPNMDGTGSAGSANTASRSDHTHPSDTSKLSLSGGTMTGALAMGSNKITGLATPTADADAATKSYVDGLISGLGSVLNYKGTVASTSALPTSGMTKGDVYIVTADNSEWVWTSDSATGTASDYEELGPTIDLSGYLEISDLASSTGSSTTTAMTQAAVTNAIAGLIKTATGTINTSATSATVAYSGTCIGTRTTMSNAVVMTDVTINSANVVFTCATAPSAAVTCTVFYI